jgi:2-methylaconitate cis-trans-isomerase PrpF
VFFLLKDLPPAAQKPGPARDKLLMRVVGSPDVYGKQIDGMGAATSSTSKAVILSKSTRPEHDVDYLFGQVSIDSAFVDWSGNCGNLSAAVGPFAISQGLVDAKRVPRDGVAVVRIWQANIGKTIISHVPMRNGEVQETGDFELDGVTFPPPRCSWSSWIPRARRAMATVARCSPPAMSWTTWRSRASAPSRRR